MESIIVLAILIVIMEFSCEGLKKLLEVIPVWEDIKQYCIPVICLLLMALLIIGTGETIIAALGIECVVFVDYLITILICSLGTNMWHEFKKQLKLAKENSEGEDA